MLERYSKNKSFMFVRKRKAMRNKRKKAKDAAATQSTVPEEYGNDEEEEAEPDRDAPSYAEHAFTFTAFEKVGSLLDSVRGRG
jgi:replication fork protection complex subunit Tof1/Swi1